MKKDKVIRGPRINMPLEKDQEPWDFKTLKQQKFLYTGILQVLVILGIIAGLFKINSNYDKFPKVEAYTQSNEWVGSKVYNRESFRPPDSFYGNILQWIFQTSLTRTEKGSIPELKYYITPGAFDSIEKFLKPIKSYHKEGFEARFTVLENKSKGGLKYYIRGLYSIRSIQGAVQFPAYFEADFIFNEPPSGFNPAGIKMLNVKSITEKSYFADEIRKKIKEKTSTE